MKKVLIKYWYVILILISFIPLYFIFVENDEDVVVETLNKEVKESKVENVKVEEIKVENSKYYVDIKGEVKNPGVYEVVSNSRVIDVVNLAGGFTKNADTSVLNLSKKVYDEMSVKIYSKKEINDIKESLVKEPEVIEVIKEVEKVIEKECDCKDL